MPSVGKAMATVFWDQKGALLIDFMGKKGATINAAVYDSTNVYELLSDVVALGC